jgi:hypothetical protein
MPIASHQHLQTYWYHVKFPLLLADLNQNLKNSAIVCKTKKNIKFYENLSSRSRIISVRMDEQSNFKSR